MAIVMNILKINFVLNPIKAQKFILFFIRIQIKIRLEYVCDHSHECIKFNLIFNSIKE